MITNQLRSGDRVRLANGFRATILDNKKGNTRLARVQGIVEECGSVYSHDIVAKLNLDGTEELIELTDHQKTLKARCRALDAVAQTW